MSVATWRIGRLALVVACIGLFALSTTQRAGAEDSSPTANAEGQVTWCKGLGGTPTVSEHRTVAEGVKATLVECSGGLGGDWHCVNEGSTANCYPSRETGDQVLGDLAGTLALSSATGSPTAQHASLIVAASDDDQVQDTNKKNKKSKKGKKGGKGRKK